MRAGNTGIRCRAGLFLYLLIGWIGSAALAGPGILSPWSESVSQGWTRVIANHGLSQSATLVEVAPGSSPKVGLGLKRAMPNFSGTIYVVEPDQVGVKKVVEAYQELFPKARIVAVPKLMHEAAADIKGPVDAVLSNHPMDDMIVGKSLAHGEAFQDLFNGMYSEKEAESLQKAKEYWQLLERQPALLRRLKSQVFRDWYRFLQQVDPGMVLISQYPSRTLQEAGVTSPDTHAREVLDRLASHHAPTSHWDQVGLAGQGLTPEHWIATVRRDPDRFGVKPAAVGRLGEGTFVEQQAHLLKPETVSLVGFNAPLASHLFGARGRDPAALHALLAGNLAVDLDAPAEQKTEKKVPVYVDYQKDPSRIADSGNKGSGRAAYLGGFNVKGLGATVMVGPEAKPYHRNGRVALPIALWELVAANAPSLNLRTGGNPVLAILALNRSFDFPDGGFGQQPIALVVRDGETLDRPVHAHQNASLPVDVMEVARAFGAQDAAKFTHRMIHGAWSAGNISLQGGQIDAETFSAVRDRAPYYTETGKYPANLFGHEWEGQLMILQDLAKRDGKVDFEAVKREFFAARRGELARGLLHLLGFAASESAAALRDPTLRPLVDRLTERFTTLSQKIYPNYAGLNPKQTELGPVAVFDFSRLFREYGARRAAGGTTPAQFLELLLNPENFTERPNEDLSERVMELLKREHVVADREALAAAKAEANAFLADLSKLFAGAEEKGTLKDPKAAAVRAFVVNETTHYLDIKKVKRFLNEVSAAYAEGRIPEGRVRDYLHMLQAANQRAPLAGHEGGFFTGARIGYEGMSRAILDPQGRTYRHQFLLFEEDLPREIREKLDKDPAITFKTPDGRTVRGEVKRHGSYVEILSGPLPFTGTGIPEAELSVGGINLALTSVLDKRDVLSARPAQPRGPPQAGPCDLAFTLLTPSL